MDSIGLFGNGCSFIAGGRFSVNRTLPASTQMSNATGSQSVWDFDSSVVSVTDTSMTNPSVTINIPWSFCLANCTLAIQGRTTTDPGWVRTGLYVIWPSSSSSSWQPFTRADIYSSLGILNHPYINWRNNTISIILSNFNNLRIAVDVQAHVEMLIFG